MISPENVKQLVDAILFLKKNKSRSQKFGNNGLNYVRNNLTIEKIGERLLRVFMEHVKDDKTVWIELLWTCNHSVYLFTDFFPREMINNMVSGFPYQIIDVRRLVD